MDRIVVEPQSVPMSTPSTKSISPMAAQLEESGRELLRKCKEQREMVDRCLSEKMSPETDLTSSMGVEWKPSRGGSGDRGDLETSNAHRRGISQAVASAEFFPIYETGCMGPHRTVNIATATPRSASEQQQYNTPDKPIPHNRRTASPGTGPYEQSSSTESDLVQQQDLQIFRLRQTVKELQNGEDLMLQVGQELLHRFRALRDENEQLRDELMVRKDTLHAYEAAIARLEVERYAAWQEVDQLQKQLDAKRARSDRGQVGCLQSGVATVSDVAGGGRPSVLPGHYYGNEDAGNMNPVVAVGAEERDADHILSFRKSKQPYVESIADSSGSM